MKTPNYILIDGHTEYRRSMQDHKVLPPGSFVRPVEFPYLPEHLKKSHAHMDKEKYVFCHSAIGFILVVRKNLREV